MYDGLSSKSNNRISITRHLLETDNHSCMWWIAPDYKTCISETSQSPKRNPQSTFIIYIHDQIAEMVEWGYTRSDSEEYRVPEGVREALIFHFSHWKNMAALSTLNRDGRIDMTIKE